jgi:hypothetical protein
LQLREPLLLIGVFLAMFALATLYSHCNFVITRDALWESGDKAERTAFLVEEITSIISGSFYRTPFTVEKALFRH